MGWAVTLVRGLLVVTLVGWFALELRQSTRGRPEATSGDRRSQQVLGATMLLGFALGILVSRLVPGARMSDPHRVAVVGLVLVWAGVALRCWSFRTLGRYFTYTVQTSPDQPVITTGPYRYVRHPSYTGMLLAMAGVSVLLESWLSLVTILVVVGSGLAYRIHVEDAVLAEALGEPYRCYAEHHKRLIPGVW